MGAFNETDVAGLELVLRRAELMEHGDPAARHTEKQGR